VAVAAAVLLCGLNALRAQAANPVQAENAQPGTTAWQQQLGGDIEIYGTQIGVAPGGEVDFHVSTAYRYRIVVYRLGWYAGTGGRQVACLPGCTVDEQGQIQPQSGPPSQAGWPVTDVLQTDGTWTSGYYLVEAALTSGPWVGRVATTYVIVSEGSASPGSRILVQVPVNTWEAYNTWGGTSLYDFLGPRSTYASFERPFAGFAQSPLWWEIQLVRFLEREGYDVSYQTDVDTDRDPGSLLRHRLVMVAGHDEYWTGTMRDAFDGALAAGTNLAFMGANEGYWHVRYLDGGQTIFSYKSIYDPNPVLAEKTAMFREIGRPECMIEGDQFQSLARIPGLLSYTVTAAGAVDPWLASTGFQPGDTVFGAVSREHDKVNPYPESCFHPGLTSLFHYDGQGVDQDGDAVRFTAPSGARVFAAGSLQFSWTLDEWRSSGSLAPTPGPNLPWQGVPADPRMQQFMRNALRDLQSPAVPAGLTVVRGADGVHVSVVASPDPRDLGFVAAARIGDRWVRICHGVSSCVGRLPPGTGLVPVGAVMVDVWRSHSAAAYTYTVRR
jgi:hypothetical protein